ncbi:DUF4235 domain-containing protein [Occultella glacieicola]|uniref:DUF4235 domain-containing protein n=1 Tax=Occultella glacieicola TaxID=2518684 RepID=A0ABY2E950_9MICO|nr:DUF4235 domain-containing protein [Occultella glacieicola]TDE99017.1 DUF4235 domain-containing protein [Occultella glacieicola]
MNAQKIVTTVAAIAAGFAANKVIELAWKGVTGHEPPTADDGEISLTELVVFAAVSGAVVAFARTFATRTAGKWLSSGDLTKG